jgi:hypothetical protein
MAAGVAVVIVKPAGSEVARDSEFVGVGFFSRLSNLTGLQNYEGKGPASR